MKKIIKHNPTTKKSAVNSLIVEKQKKDPSRDNPRSYVKRECIATKTWPIESDIDVCTLLTNLLNPVTGLPFVPCNEIEQHKGNFSGTASCAVAGDNETLCGMISDGIVGECYFWNGICMSPIAIQNTQFFGTKGLDAIGTNGDPSTTVFDGSIASPGFPYNSDNYWWGFLKPQADQVSRWLTCNTGDYFCTDDIEFLVSMANMNETGFDTLMSGTLPAADEYSYTWYELGCQHWNSSTNPWPLEGDGCSAYYNVTVANEGGFDVEITDGDIACYELISFSCTGINAAIAGGCSAPTSRDQRISYNYDWLDYTTNNAHIPCSSGGNDSGLCNSASVSLQQTTQAITTLREKTRNQKNRPREGTNQNKPYNLDPFEPYDPFEINDLQTVFNEMHDCREICRDAADDPHHQERSPSPSQINYKSNQNSCMKWCAACQRNPGCEVVQGERNPSGGCEDWNQTIYNACLANNWEEGNGCTAAGLKSGFNGSVASLTAAINAGYADMNPTGGTMWISAVDCDESAAHDGYGGVTGGSWENILAGTADGSVLCMPWWVFQPYHKSQSNGMHGNCSLNTSTCNCNTAEDQTQCNESPWGDYTFSIWPLTGTFGENQKVIAKDECCYHGCNLTGYDFNYFKSYDAAENNNQILTMLGFGGIGGQQASGGAPNSRTFGGNLYSGPYWNQRPLGNDAYCHLVGALPITMGNLRNNIRSLNLQNNCLTSYCDDNECNETVDMFPPSIYEKDNSTASGTIESWSRLWYLDFSSNNFRGSNAKLHSKFWEQVGISAIGSWIDYRSTGTFIGSGGGATSNGWRPGCWGIAAPAYSCTCCPETGDIQGCGQYSDGTPFNTMNAIFCSDFSGYFNYLGLGVFDIQNNGISGTLSGLEAHIAAGTLQKFNISYNQFNNRLDDDGIFDLGNFPDNTCTSVEPNSTCHSGPWTAVHWAENLDSSTEMLGGYALQNQTLFDISNNYFAGALPRDWKAIAKRFIPDGWISSTSPPAAWKINQQCGNEVDDAYYQATDYYSSEFLIHHNRFCIQGCRADLTAAGTHPETGCEIVVTEPVLGAPEKIEASVQAAMDTGGPWGNLIQANTNYPAEPCRMLEQVPSGGSVWIEGCNEVNTACFGFGVGGNGTFLPSNNACDHDGTNVGLCEYDDFDIGASSTYTNQYQCAILAGTFTGGADCGMGPEIKTCYWDCDLASAGTTGSQSSVVPVCSCMELDFGASSCDTKCGNDVSPNCWMESCESQGTCDVVLTYGCTDDTACNYPNCNDDDGLPTTCAYPCPSTGINTGYYPDGCVEDQGGDMYNIETCYGSCVPCVFADDKGFTCYKDTDGDGYWNQIHCQTNLGAPCVDNSGAELPYIGQFCSCGQVTGDDFIEETNASCGCCSGTTIDTCDWTCSAYTSAGCVDGMLLTHNGPETVGCCTEGKCNYNALAAAGTDGFVCDNATCLDPVATDCCTHTAGSPNTFETAISVPVCPTFTCLTECSSPAHTADGNDCTNYQFTNAPCDSEVGACVDSGNITEGMNVYLWDGTLFESNVLNGQENSGCVPGETCDSACDAVPLAGVTYHNQSVCHYDLTTTCASDQDYTELLFQTCRDNYFNNSDYQNSYEAVVWHIDYKTSYTFSSACNAAACMSAMGATGNGWGTTADTHCIGCIGYCGDGDFEISVPNTILEGCVDMGGVSDSCEAQGYSSTASTNFGCTDQSACNFVDGADFSCDGVYDVDDANDYCQPNPWPMGEGWDPTCDPNDPGACDPIPATGTDCCCLFNVSHTCYYDRQWQGTQITLEACCGLADGSTWSDPDCSGGNWGSSYFWHQDMTVLSDPGTGWCGNGIYNDGEASKSMYPCEQKGCAWYGMNELPSSSIVGCMDTSACDYNPDANVDSGTCKYDGTYDISVDADHLDGLTDTDLILEQTCLAMWSSTGVWHLNAIVSPSPCTNNVDCVGWCGDGDYESLINVWLSECAPIVIPSDYGGIYTSADGGPGPYGSTGCMESNGDAVGDVCNYDALADEACEDCCEVYHSCCEDILPAGGNGNCDNTNYELHCDSCDTNWIESSNNNDIYGCQAASACNYDSDATIDDEGCTYADENYDCDGNCTEPLDCAGTCAGALVLDECGICDGDDTDCDVTGCRLNTYCNYTAGVNAFCDGCTEAIWAVIGNTGVCIDPMHEFAWAVANDECCTLPDADYDCEGACCTADCNTGTATVFTSICGASVACIATALDCAGTCGGDLAWDECGVCAGDSDTCATSGCRDSGQCQGSDGTDLPCDGCSEAMYDNLGGSTGACADQGDSWVRDDSCCCYEDSDFNAADGETFCGNYLTSPAYSDLQVCDDSTACNQTTSMYGQAPYGNSDNCDTNEEVTLYYDEAESGGGTVWYCSTCSLTEIKFVLNGGDATVTKCKVPDPSEDFHTQYCGGATPEDLDCSMGSSANGMSVKCPAPSMTPGGSNMQKETGVVISRKWGDTDPGPAAFLPKGCHRLIELEASGHTGGVSNEDIAFGISDGQYYPLAYMAARVCWYYEFWGETFANCDANVCGMGAGSNTNDSNFHIPVTYFHGFVGTEVGVASCHCDNDNTERCDAACLADFYQDADWNPYQSGETANLDRCGVCGGSNGTDIFTGEDGDIDPCCVGGACNT